MSVNKFFEEINIPVNYEEKIKSVKHFIAQCAETGRKLVLVSVSKSCNGEGHVRESWVNWFQNP